MPFTNTVLQTDPYTTNGVTTNFPFYFQALSKEELQVYLVNSTTLAETILATGFDVIGVGEPNGGYVAFPTAPSYPGQTLRIRSVPSAAQTFDFENQSAYNPRDLNRALDRAAQRSIYVASRAVGGGNVGGSTDWTAVTNKPTVFTPAAHTHLASDVTSGIFDIARIPNLDTAKIATGVFDVARIPNVDASKVTSGVFDSARIPPVSAGVVASGDITTLTTAQQAAITEGVVVTTVDGNRYAYKGTGSKTLLASYTAIGSTATDWSVIPNKPANVVNFAGLVGAADRLAYFTGVSTQAVTPLTSFGRQVAGVASLAALAALATPLTTKGDLYGYAAAPARLPVGVDGQVLVADSAQTTGLRWMTSSAATGVQNMPNFVTLFSGNGDGVTNNDAALTAAEASAYERIWLPEGKYVTTRASYTDFNKRFVGPGKFLRAAGRAVNNFSRYVDAVWTVNDEYGQGGNSQFANIELAYLPPNTRHHFTKGPTGLYPYFYAPAVPHFLEFNSSGGSSGFAGKTSTAITAGVTTTIGIAGGTVGWVAGDAIGLTQSTTLDGTILESAVIASVDTVGGTITLTAPPANAYAIGSVLSFGCRTMNTGYTTILNHKGGGDAYAYLARVIVEKPALASQTDFAHVATGGIIGGDMVCVYSGGYLTGWECQYSDASDGTSDITVAGSVNSYIRKNATRGRNAFWIHDLAKMDAPTVGNGLKPIDVVYSCLMYAQCGLDMTRSVFNNQRAITLAKGHRIYLDASASAGTAANAAGYIPDINPLTFIGANTAGQIEIAHQSGNSLTVYAGGVSVIGPMASTGAMSPAGVASSGAIDTSVNYRVGGTVVTVGRLGTIPDATVGTEASVINSVLSALRQHGLITGAGNP